MAYGDTYTDGGDWFDTVDNEQDATGRRGAGSGSGGGFGHPVYDAIAAVWRAAMGREPTLAEVSQWGADIDDRYMNAITRHIYGLPESIRYRESQQQGGGGGSAGGSGGGTSGGVTMEDIRRRLKSGDRDTIIQALRDLAALRGVRVRESSYGTWADYILRGNGEVYDPDYFIDRVINDDDEFNGRPTRDNSPYTKPYEKEVKLDEFEPPPDFEAPNPEDVFNDPSFRFRMGEGIKALERSAAARGTLLTGGTLKDIGSWVSDYSSSEYDKIYDRARSEDEMRYGRSAGEYDIARNNALTRYGLDRENFWANQDRPFAKWMQLLGIGVGATNAANNAAAGYTGGAARAMSSGGTAANNALTAGSNAQALAAAQRAASWGAAPGYAANALGAYAGAAARRRGSTPSYSDQYYNY